MSVTTAVNADKYTLGTTDMKHSKGTTTVQVVTRLAPPGGSSADEVSRYYRSPLLAQTAHNDLTKHGATFATLGNSFNGRDAFEMAAFLDKNHRA